MPSGHQVEELFFINSESFHAAQPCHRRDRCVALGRGGRGGWEGDWESSCQAGGQLAGQRGHRGESPTCYSGPCSQRHPQPRVDLCLQQRKGTLVNILQRQKEWALMFPYWEGGSGELPWIYEHVSEN